MLAMLVTGYVIVAFAALLAVADLARESEIIEKGYGS